MECGTGKEREAWAASIFGIADQGVLHGRRLHPDLVGAAGFKGESGKGQCIPGFRMSEIPDRMNRECGCLGTTRSFPHRFDFIGGFIFQKPMLPALASTRGKGSLENRVIAPIQFAGFELLAQSVCALGSFGHYHQAARIAIEAVDQSHIVATEMGTKKVHEGRFSG